MHPESSSTSGYETDTESRNRQHHRRQFQFKKVPQSRKTLHEIEDISESSGYETTADFTTFSSITPEKIPKQRLERKIADTFRKSKYLPKDQSSSDSDSENDMVPNTTGAMNYFQQSCQLSKEYKNKEFFHSHAIQHGLKLSKRCVARLQNECARENKGKKDFYTVFLKPQKLLSLLQRYPMKYKQGILQIDSSHGAICKIKNATDGIDLIVISGRSKCGKAYTDDEVVVEVLLENSEIPRLGKIIQPRQKVFGKVVGILARKRKENIDHPVYVCELDSFDNYKAKPICKTIPKLHLVRKNFKEKNYFTVDLYKYNAERKDLLPDRQMRITPSRRRKYLFYVVFISWPATYPIGVAIDVHKSTTSFLNGMRILDLQYEIPTIYKPSTVTKLQQKLHVKFADKKADREDLTENIKAFTIDPKGTKVLDDAISIDKSDDGSFRVGVHISDVTAYIEKGDEIDIEAAERGTTYFSGRYNDPHCMLPEPLSLDTCSLLPGLSRLTITVFLFFGSDFKPRAHTIGKSYIKSSEQLSYEQVQAVIDGHSVKSKWKEHIDDLFRIATAVRRNRLGNAMWGVPFEYDFGEDLETRTNCFEAYYLIEEFMILANESVAKLLMSLPLFKDRVPLRCQDAPPTKRVQDWLKSYPKILDQIIQLQGVKPLEHREISFANLEDGRRLRYTEISFIQKWIWNLFTSYMNEGNFRQAGRLLRQDEIHPYQALAIDEWISFQENAEYRCSGNLANKRQGSHFGLNKYPYVHFTSPIRRYIDIVTHRLLHAAISPTTTAKDIPYSSKEVQTICTQMNRISLQAKTYDNKCKSLHLASDLQKKPTVFYGFVKFSSDQDLALVFPGLRYLNDECTTLTLNNLDVCCQPIFKRDVERVNLPAERNIMELIWDKRIYSNLKRRPYPKTPRNGYQYAQNDEPQRIDPHQRTEIHQSTKWMKFLVSACSINNLSKCKQSFTEITDASPLRYVTTSFDTEYDINCELEKKRQPDENIVDTPNEDGLNSLSTKTKSKTEKRRKYPSIITKQSCKFSMTFSHGQVVSVQMSANIQKGILTPYIQFVDMTENVKFCLEHMRDPVYCLEQYTVNKTKPKYENLEEYKDIWLPIIQMESVMSAVRSDTIVINDVDVNLKDSDGSFNLKSEFCDERNIILSSMAISFLDKNVPADGSEESKKYYMPRTDYLCIRCPLFRNPLEPGSGYSLDKPSEFTTWNKWRPDEYYIWSTHAKITSVDTYKNSGNIAVNFRIHKNAGKQPPDLPSGKNRLKKCCVEIMPKSAIAMRIENAIRFLHEATALSRSIAIKKNIPDFNDADDHLKAISQTDIEIGLPKNNKDQKKAIKMALTKRFSLIHGPPGTSLLKSTIYWH
ncbi:Hypothetical predicted protein [Mytilus galloprovincialis]|uniref:RNB domain-containing protein n=1 Tax=Mytilus galloprovincialis TaxID=29158 RepID=A0A8B6DH65_MYTGA|nr:Hypothetical predicted protein [Mytilus galloprovincialis]